MRVGPNNTKKYPPVIERKLSRNPYKKGAVMGQCDSEGSGLILIDPRLRPLDYMDTLVHELLHREFCFLREDVVEEVATVISKELWERGYRKTVI